MGSKSGENGVVEVRETGVSKDRGDKHLQMLHRSQESQGQGRRPLDLESENKVVRVLVGAVSTVAEAEGRVDCTF